ncbi:MAG: hypothetical protein ABFR50_00010 [Candidatus Fermentibacteria bacterium]
MVNKYKMAFAAIALLIIPGCTDLTEFDHSMMAGISVFHTPDLTCVHTIENISGARSLCALPDCFIAATTEGTVFRFDLQTYEQTGIFNIGSPSSSGYHEIEYSFYENSVYIIGALGQILEVSVPDMEVLDAFNVCETPVDIEVSPDPELSFFYVAGATSRRIFELKLASNAVSRSCILPSSPTCMAIPESMDTIMVGTLAETEIVSLVTASMKRRRMDHFPGILAIETVPNDTTFCAVFSSYSLNSISTILKFFPNPFSPDPLYTGVVNIEGDIHYMAAAESDGTRIYVLSYMGNNGSRLISYNCVEYFIESQIDLPGYPLDLEISPGGTLLVLTAE